MPFYGRGNCSAVHGTAFAYFNRGRASLRRAGISAKQQAGPEAANRLLVRTHTAVIRRCGLRERVLFFLCVIEISELECKLYLEQVFDIVNVAVKDFVDGGKTGAQCVLVNEELLFSFCF